MYDAWAAARCCAACAAALCLAAAASILTLALAVTTESGTDQLVAWGGWVGREGGRENESEVGGVDMLGQER